MPALDFAALKIDALLVSAPPNIRYLSGFTGSNGLLLVEAEAATLFTDPRYTLQAAAESSADVKIAKGPLIPAVAQWIERKRFKRIGFEKSRLTYEAWQSLKEKLPLGANLRPIGGVIERLRMIKTDDEIARIRRSVTTNSKAFVSALKRIRAGATESEIAAELEYQQRLHGAQKAAFDTIVAGGERSALPHAQPTNRKLSANDLLLIDMGATENGYMSDMTRVVFLGAPGRKLRSMYRAVSEAQQSAIDGVRPGATAAQVDRKARKVLDAAGLGKTFTHSTGHGLGLEIHEAPRLGKKDRTPLEAGMVITIEPGAYVEGLGGIRIEDTVLVTDDGCEILTPTSKELTVLE
jgi:Xaa-Pro aminopeptidase